MGNQEKGPSKTVQCVLNLGIVGIGVGAREVLPALENFDEIRLAAGADINKRVRDTFAERYDVPIYSSIEELAADPNVDAVWVSSPNRFHCEHTLIAAEQGKHVIVEKPMAISLAEAKKMIEVTQKNGVKLICGHTQSYSPAVRKMLQVIRSERVGEVKAIHIIAYTDWLLSPRSQDELDLSQGGGIPFRQGPHQVDTVRLLAGGMVQSVRAHVGQWMPTRPIPGYHSAFMEFENGVHATVIHNGYGYFNTNELVPWGSADQKLSAEDRPLIRRKLVSGEYSEDDEKDSLRIGGKKEGDRQRRRRDGSWIPWDLGLVIVSCERGDLRHSRHGLYVYDDNGIDEIAVPDATNVRRAELTELYNAVVHGDPVYHSGRWGMATLEVCIAMMTSSEERKELTMQHQVPTPEDYV